MTIDPAVIIWGYITHSRQYLENGFIALQMVKLEKRENCFGEVL